MKLGKSKAPEVSGFLDDGTEIIGDLRFSDILHLRGRFNGRIMSDGELVVGESGVVEGDVEVGALTLAGTIKGNIYAHERTHLLKTSCVIGDIFTPMLSVDEGASCEGSINTTSTAAMARDDKRVDRVAREKQTVTTFTEVKEAKIVG